MSRYENYEIKNNVFGTLSAPISSLATTIQLGDGQGARFSENMLATLENIENGKVMKREIVLITAINGDTLTVTRKYAPCPDNDEANTQGQVSYAFSTDDTISAYIDKEHFDEIKKSINDIYENGLDKLRTDIVSGLEISVSAGPVLVGSSYYEFAGDTITLTDNTTNYVEIDEDGNLVANTTSWTLENTKISKVITSGGAITSIEDWRLGTVGGKIGGTDIHELTEKTSISPNDEFIVSDSDNIYNNKKVKYSTLSKQVLYSTAGENLSKGDIVYITNNQAFKVSISNQGVIPFQAYVVLDSVNTNETVVLIFNGVADGFSGLTNGKKYFISGTAGQITDQKNGGFMVGVAISNTEILLKNEYFVIKDGTDVLIEDTTEHYAQSTTAIEIFSQTMDFNGEISLNIQYKRTNGYNDNIEIIGYINGTQIFSYSQLPNNYDYWYCTQSAIAINNGDAFTITARRTSNYGQRYLVDNIQILGEYNILYK